MWYKTINLHLFFSIVIVENVKWLLLFHLSRLDNWRTENLSGTVIKEDGTSRDFNVGLLGF